MDLHAPWADVSYYAYASGLPGLARQSDNAKATSVDTGNMTKDDGKARGPATYHCPWFETMFDTEGIFGKRDREAFGM